MKSTSHFPAAFLASICLLVLLGPVSCGGKGGALEPAPPTAISGVQRSALLTGGQADDAVLALQPVPIPPAESWVAVFSGNDPIRVYASRFNDATEAEVAVGRMRSLLAARSGPLPPSKPANVAGQSGYKIDGSGHDHFFFLKGVWLVWIESPARDFDAAVRSVAWSKR